MKILKAFQDNNETKGWLKLKGTTISHDKQKHVALGLVAMICVSIYYYFFKEVGTLDRISASIEGGAAWTIPLAIAKEVYDFILFKLGKKPNWIPFPDIIATVLIPIIILLISNFVI